MLGLVLSLLIAFQGTATPAARERIVTGLDGLAEHLLAHLAFEEREIAPTVLTWERWPGAEWKGASSL